MHKWFWLFAGLFAAAVQAAPPALSEYLDRYCDDCASRAEDRSGLYILEKGEEALMCRAWLAGQAARSIDVQYFIWSTDNIGILAIENLLTAAGRGVKVRILVDDLLVDAEEEHLLELNAHPNLDIKVYNPNHSVGVSGWKRYWHILTDFRGSNQRMHDKTAIYDDIAGITGGRNMANEYFDYNHEYNFRDRDVLVVGEAVGQMRANFEEFWNSDLSVAVDAILDPDGGILETLDPRDYYRRLHAYARDPRNFEPEVREALSNIERVVPEIIASFRWSEAVFISDRPGKNSGEDGLDGGGAATSVLVEAVRSARESVLIQSPYLVMPEGGLELFAGLVERGVKVTISTNSLASTDNLYAFSGYYDQREELLEAGIDIYEYKPDPAVQQELVDRYERLEHNNPVLAIHAKTLVVDNELVYIGTFNLDPRSANLNTEVGILARDPGLAEQAARAIGVDIRVENSWRVTETFNPDGQVPFLKRLKVYFLALLPLDPLL